MEVLTLLKAVIFDMDGVIIDSEPLHAKAAVLALKQYNLDITEEYCTPFIGSTTKHMCETIVQQFSLDVSAEELTETNNRMKESLARIKGYPPVPYVKELIKDLHSNGLRLLIASSSPRSAIEFVLESLDLHPYFEGYISGMDIKRPKPAPDIFLKAVKQLGLTIDDCIIIEDSSNGVNAACNANIPCIALLNPNSGIQDLSKANFLVESFEEVDTEFIQMVYDMAHPSTSFCLETNRLYIKECTMDDMPIWFQICQDPLIRPLLSEPFGTYDEERAKFEAYREHVYRYYGFGLWGVYDKSTGHMIGRCGLELKNIEGQAEYELGYLINPKYHQQGYGTEAVKAVIQYGLEFLNLHRILVVIKQSNLHSINFAKKLGFTYTSTMTRYSEPCNIYEIKAT